MTPRPPTAKPVLRQPWGEAGFHAALAALVGAAAGDRILDLGCGAGRSFGPLLAAVGGGGKVVGLDRLQGSFAEIAHAYAPEVEAGALVLVPGDVLDPPFPDESFDAVLCQNVAECVDDRVALVARARRLLKPGGRLLLGHHDFDGIMISGAGRDLTRRLVHGYADHQQDWQQASEGRMGRMIPGLVAQAGFESVEIEARLFVETDLRVGSYAREYVGSVVDLAPGFGVDEDVAARWASTLAAAAADGLFFFGLPWVGGLCRKALF